MTYSMQQVYEKEREYETDLQRIQQLYPFSVKKILYEVQEVCDRLEYEGSLMFAQYLDPVTMYGLVCKICRQLEPWEEGKEPEAKTKELYQETVWALLCQEMYYRRCRQRRCRKYW